MSHVPMTAPAQKSNFPTKEKNPNLELVPQGLHPAIIYGVINVGTQDGEYQGRQTASNKLKLAFELPFHRQLYYKDDTEPSPSAMIMDFNYSVSKNKKSGKKSKLLLLIESLSGPLQESQYLTFDIGQLAGLKVFVNVVHYLKNDGSTGAKIDSVSQFNPGMVNPDTVVLTNPIQKYSVQMGFDIMDFAKLPYFYRNLVKESHEGKAHAAAGGRFTKLDENGNMIIDDGTSGFATPPATKLVMTGQYTFEQLKAAGWTEQAMIENGYARRENVQAPAPTPTPAPAPVQNFAQPQAPMSIQPQMPQAHTNPTQPMLTMIDKSASYEDYRKAGWSDEQLIQSGKAMMMPAANDVFPQTPQPIAPPSIAPPTAGAIPVAIPPLQTAPQPVIPQQPIAPAMPQAPMAQNIPAPVPSASAMFQQGTAAPVEQMSGVPNAIPQAPVSNFETPTPMNGIAPPDDLPF